MRHTRQRYFAYRVCQRLALSAAQLCFNLSARVDDDSRSVYGADCGNAIFRRGRQYAVDALFNRYSLTGFGGTLGIFPLPVRPEKGNKINGETTARRLTTGGTA